MPWSCPVSGSGRIRRRLQRWRAAWGLSALVAGLPSRYVEPPAVVQVSAQNPRNRGKTVATMIIFHDVDDVDHWLSSPRRDETFGPLGITVRTFVDPSNTHRAGLIAEIPDMDAFQAVMQSQAGADAMKFDGVRPETLVSLVEA
jgi:hypothetical protein